MRSTGDVRRVDQLGRIVLPAKLRKELGMDTGEPVEIYVSGECVVYKKYVPTCYFCGNSKELKEHKGKKICGICWEELSNYPTGD